jgi:hypothetical protein
MVDLVAQPLAAAAAAPAGLQAASSPARSKTLDSKGGRLARRPSAASWIDNSPIAQRAAW